MTTAHLTDYTAPAYRPTEQDDALTVWTTADEKEFLTWLYKSNRSIFHRQAALIRAGRRRYAASVSVPALLDHIEALERREARPSW